MNEAASVKQFETDGAICLRQVFASEWVDLLRPGVMSPPPGAYEGAPADGAPMDSDAFPVVWRAAA
jgi:hypothetical protein